MLCRLLVALCTAHLLLAPSISIAGPAIVFDAETGQIIHAHQPSQRWYPASLTKLMTVYVAFRAAEDGRIALDDKVTISERALQQPFNMMGWPAGTEVTVEEAVRILMVKSANDVAVALAEIISGDVDEFVVEMNRQAQALGMTGSRFANPNGVHHTGNYTTARDLGLLAQALVREFPQHRHFFGLTSTEVRGESMQNYNRLLGSFAGADGMKTGYVCESGYSMVASATRAGRTLVAVVLGAMGEGERAEVAARLLEKGFAAGASEAPRLDELQDAETIEAFDMRPHACGGRALPADIASFGLD